MAFSILPVTVQDDLPALAALVHRSKQTLPINRLLFKDWPNEAAQKPIYAGAVEAAFKDPSHDMWKVVDVDSREIVAELVLARVKPAGAAEAIGDVKGEIGEVKKDTGDNDTGGMLADMNPEIRSVVEEAVQAIHKDLQGIDHFHLVHIYVTNACRNMGLGTQLMQLCIQTAEKEGLPLALDSEPEVHGFFLKLGFRDTTYFDIDLRRWAPEFSGYGLFRLWGMVRDPATKSAPSEAR